MKMIIQMLADADMVKERLQGDGWLLESQDSGNLVICHRFAFEETEARIRLHRLGLLTSGRVRIEFCPTMAPP